MSAPDEDSTTPSLVSSMVTDAAFCMRERNARDLVARDLPPAPLGQVAHAEHEVVAHRRADHLHEPPSVGPAHAQLERRAHVLALDAREREGGELEIVGMDEVEPVHPDRLVHRDPEEALGGAVGPTHVRARVDHQDGVGQGDRDRGQGREVIGGPVVRVEAHPVAGHCQCSSAPDPE